MEDLVKYYVESKNGRSDGKVKQMIEQTGGLNVW